VDCRDHPKLYGEHISLLLHPWQNATGSLGASDNSLKYLIAGPN
jgi:hypothetical protein